MLVYLIIIALGLHSGVCQSLTNTVHKTQGAKEKINDLHCYSCHTMEDGELCSDFLANTSFTKKCQSNEFNCMKREIRLVLSNENSTSQPKVWSLERKCAVKCEPGCIIIGERTKLYACTSCCDKSLCNIGRGGANAFNLNYRNLLSYFSNFQLPNIIVALTLCANLLLKSSTISIF